MSFFNKIKQNNAPNCTACGEFKEAENPRMGVQGKGEKGILVLTKCPSKRQDQTGNLFEGEATAFFKKELKALGIELERDCWVVPSIGCHTTLDSNKAAKKAQFCQPRVEQIIEQKKPHIIFVLGTTPLNQLYSDRAEKLNIQNAQGKVAPDYTFKCWSAFLPHPSNIVRKDEYDNSQADDEFYMAFYRRMLKNAVSYVDKQLPPYKDFNSMVSISTDYSTVMKWIKTCLNEEPWAWVSDLETNCTNPFLPEARVESISFCYNDEMAYAFPFGRSGIFTDIQQRNIQEEYCKIISNRNIGKVFHNGSLEDNFWNVLFKTPINNWLMDTMPACHLLDVTQGTKGLKYQLFVRYGIEDYNKGVQSFLESDSMEYNNIHKIPLDKLLIYNAIDSLGNKWLFNDLYSAFKYDDPRRKFKLRECNNLYQNMTRVLLKAYRTGVDIDPEYFAESEKEMQNTIDELKEKLYTSPEGKLFEKKEGKKLDITNNNEIGRLLFDYLGYEPPIRTKTGLPSTKKDSLESVGIPFVEDLLEVKKLEKSRNDFVSKIPKFAIDNKVHGECSVSFARSGRSNSFSPNLTQLPKRSKYISKLVRGGFKPRKGHRWASFDVGALEISTNCCNSGDPVLRNYILTPGADPHHDISKDVFMANDKQITKEIRQMMKSNFTFLSFYCGHPHSAAKRIYNCWDHMLTGDGITLHEHMRIRGIDSIWELRDHCTSQVDKLWDRFNVFHKYQSEKANEYFEKGYISNPIGFRRSGYVTPNQSINSPAQGLGFQWVGTGMVMVSDWLDHEKLESKFLFQIHDDLNLSIAEEETQYVVDNVVRLMTKEVENYYEHITVPLRVDPELSEIDGSWYEVKPWEKVDGVWQVKQ